MTIVSLGSTFPPAMQRLSTMRRPFPASGCRVVLAWLVVGYLASLGLRPLVTPDEFRYAEAAREMVAGGDWIVPHLNGAVYFEKPILGYWATALSLRIFGDSAAATRLPCALATLGTAWILASLLRRFGPGRGWAEAAAAAFLTSVGVAALGTAAVFDALLAFGVTATLAALFVATQRPPGRSRQAWLALCGVACGLAFLTKGFVAFAIPITVAVPFCVAAGRWREIPRLGATPLAAALVTAAPWSIAIALREPDYWRFFIVHEHFQRFAGGSSAQHAQPFWFYVPIVLIGALPWTPLLVWVARRDVFDSPLARFSLAWVVGPLLLLSVSSGKLATYVLPCFPALFALLAIAAARRPASQRAAGLRGLSAGLAGSCLLAGLALLAAPAAVPGLDAVLGEGSAALLHAWAAGLLLAAGVAGAGRLTRSPARAGAAIAAAMTIGYGTALAFFPTGRVHKTPEEWLRVGLDPIAADAIVVAHRDFVYPLCWRLRRDDVVVLGGPGELGYGLSRADQHDRVLDGPALAALLGDPLRRRPVIVVTFRDSDPLPTEPRPLRTGATNTTIFAEYAPLAAGTEPAGRSR